MRTCLDCHHFFWFDAVPDLDNASDPPEMGCLLDIWHTGVKPRTREDMTQYIDLLHTGDRCARFEEKEHDPDAGQEG